ncbi:MAG: Tar ligand binding domain-containing protein [Sulfuricella sp.]|nr:Tar ligand binding domain-containing protein [Sulfuricella sp.]
MKTNLPITGREKNLPAGSMLVSRTDAKGIITYANDAFVEISGFSREELIGSNHNISRHPDVPSSVFEDMWRTLKRGLPWRGIVKNRCKDGDHYWVDAQAVPVRKNGETIGYMSVRSEPAREDVTKAEAAYLKATRARHPAKAIACGGWKKLLSVKNGVAIGIVFVTLLMVAGGVLGISGLLQSSAAMKTHHYEEMVPVRTIGRINFLMADNRAQIALALHHNPAAHGAGEFDHSLSAHLNLIEKNRQEIDALWQSYSALPRSGAERELADKYWALRLRYVVDGLKPAVAALEQGDYKKAEGLLLKNVTPLYRQANVNVVALLEFLSKKAERNFLDVSERNRTISIIAAIGVVAGILAVMLSGLFFFRGTVAPLEAAIAALERITEGNLSDRIDTSTGYGEPGRVMNAVVAMQLSLKVMMDEIRRSSGSIHEQCRCLNHIMMNLAEHSEEQHDRVYQTLDNVTQSCSGLGKLADEAEAVMQLVENPEKTAATGAKDDAEAERAAEFGAVVPDIRQLAERVNALAGAVRLEAFTLDDTTVQMNQVASLIVDIRGEVQGAWAASQQLEQTARELDKLVKYFE